MRPLPYGTIEFNHPFLAKWTRHRYFVHSSSLILLDPQDQHHQLKHDTSPEQVAYKPPFLQLFGELVEVDTWLDWRVHYGQRVGAIFGAASMTSYLLNTFLYGNRSVYLLVACVFFAIGMFVCLGTIYFRNISTTIFWRLLREVNVVTILVLSICNFIIDVVRPYNEFSIFNGFIYLFGITIFLFLDAVKKKSRVFVLTIGSIFVFITIVEIYYYSFVDWESGVILFQYGDRFLFRKRAIKRSIFVQIFTFSLNGLRTMLKDKRMEMMMFVAIFTVKLDLFTEFWWWGTRYAVGRRRRQKIDDLDLIFSNNKINSFAVHVQGMKPILR